MSMFSSPASASGGVDLDTMKGHLLIITPVSVEENIATSFGPKDAVRADVVDLDTNEVYNDTLLFPRVLIGQLRPRIGGKVLGRLGQGVAKPGQKAPWLLEDFSPADAQKAEAYLAKAPSFSSASSAPTGDVPPPF